MKLKRGDIVELLDPRRYAYRVMSDSYLNDEGVEQIDVEISNGQTYMGLPTTLFCRIIENPPNGLELVKVLNALR